IPVDRFLDAADHGHRSLPPYLPEGKPLEGFLFPQTYDFLAHGTTPGEVIDRLLQEFATEAGSLPWQNAEGLGVSPYQVVTIASMIEREAKVPEDRPLIAAVIYNRLDRDMSLGIDATVQYIDPDPANGLTTSDFLIESPYNTRLHPGLPPTRAWTGPTSPCRWRWATSRPRWRACGPWGSRGRTSRCRTRRTRPGWSATSPRTPNASAPSTRSSWGRAAS